MEKSIAKKSIKIFVASAWKFKIGLIFAFVGAISSVLASSFLSPYIVSRFIGNLQSGASITVSNTKNLIILYIVAQIVGEVIGWRVTLLSIWNVEVKAQKNLHKKILNHLMNRSVGFHANTFSGALVSQTNKFIGAFERFWDTIIFQAVTTATSIIAAIVILYFIFWQYALMLLVLSVTLTSIIFYGSRFMKKRNIEEADASTKLTGRLADVLGNILAVKSHGREDFELKEYEHMANDWMKKSLHTMWGFLKVSSVYSLFIVIINATAFISAVWATEHNLINVATIYLCVSYTLTVSRQLWEMNNIIRNYNRIVGDANAMTIILNEKSEINDSPESEKSIINEGAITFDDVVFTHSESEETLFKKLALNIRPGEKVGIVGHSGSGKTTLTKLLLRFMDIESGAIRIDGQNIAKLRQSELRKKISYVPQEPILFHRSLKENIKYGRTKASDEQVEEVSKLAHADEFIQKLPEKYNTMVGERGVKLSGGQRQRIAIARAMLKDAPILLLDEATSALDSESEELIQDALWKLMENKTALVIAHRLSTVQKMDRIIVMKNGAIVEEGTHKELVKKAGVYADLWNRQSGGFID